MTSKDKDVQGEGNRDADRHYREHTREFVESGRVDEAAKKAREESSDEDARAEEQGRRRAKEEDPEVHRDYDKPSESD